MVPCVIACLQFFHLSYPSLSVYLLWECFRLASQEPSHSIQCSYSVHPLHDLVHLSMLSSTAGYHRAAGMQRCWRPLSSHTFQGVSPVPFAWQNRPIFCIQLLPCITFGCGMGAPSALPFLVAQPQMVKSRSILLLCVLCGRQQLLPHPHAVGSLGLWQALLQSHDSS